MSSSCKCRAYRHHRKRLARIVADQWMHVAQYRLLTLKFRIKRETNIKRICVTEWRNMVEHRARMSHIFERASVLCRFLMERRSFHAWKKVFLRNRDLADAFRRTVDMGTNLLLSHHGYHILKRIGEQFAIEPGL